MVEKKVNEELSGIILMGGTSRRMGEDKSVLLVQGKPLYLHATEKLEPYCEHIFLSANKHQALHTKYELPLIIDQYDDQGPLGGILSSLECVQKSIFVLAVDMPYITGAEIQLLLNSRKQGQHVSLYYNSEANKYEAMFSIWEISVLPILKSFFSGGGRSAQSLLRALDVPGIPMEDNLPFRSVNTTDEWAAIEKN